MALGIRASGGPQLSGIWISAGLLLGLLVALNKVENDLVHVARHYAGLPQVRDAEEVKVPQRGGLRSARRIARFVPFHRVFHSVELSILVLLAAVLDLFTDGMATKVLLTGLGGLGRASPSSVTWPRCSVRRGCDEPTDRPRYGVVVLTMGSRPADLDRGLRSLLAQRDVDLDVVVVGNGWQPTGLPDGVKAHGLPENLGIPAGRNAGVPLVSGDLLFFLDDDASLPA